MGTKGLRAFVGGVPLWLLIGGALFQAIPVSAEIMVEKWQIAGPFMAPHYWRNSNLDYLVPHGGEEAIIASPSQVFYAEQPDGGEVRWFELEAEEPHVKVIYPNTHWENIKEKFGRRWTRNIGYAYAEIESPERKHVLVYTQYVLHFYIDSIRYEGEHYYKTYHGVPATLKKGKNRVLVKFSGSAEPRFSFKVVPVAEDVVFLDDYETPDLIEGEILESGSMGIPLVNTTEEWLRNIEVVVQGDEHFKTQATPVPPLAPQSITKVPVRFTQQSLVEKGEEDQGYELDLEVVAGEGILYSGKIPLRIRTASDHRKITFVSKVDGSVQYFALHYPKNYDPDREYALIFYLHGGGDRAWDVVGLNSPKDWAFVVAPTNRRPHGWNWWDFARFNVYETMALVKERFNIDEKRIYMTGASNGGQGTWYHILHNPSIFAAAAPLAAWTSYALYLPRFFDADDLFSAPDLRAIRNRVEREFQTPNYVINAANLPVISTQGGDDTVVLPINQRLFRKLMQNYGNEIVYREFPGRPHFWHEPRVDGVGADCIDNPEISAFLRSRTLNPYPQRVVFKLCDLSVNNRFYWVTVKEQKQVYYDTEVEAEVTGNTVAISSSNVEALELYLPEELVPGNQVEISWNDAREKVALDDSRKVSLGSVQEQKSLRKTPELYGPLKAAFFKPSIFVCGTRGTREESDILLHNARAAAHRFWRKGNGYARMVRDIEVDEQMIASYNLILFGSPERNHLTARIMKKLPIQIEKGKVFLGDTLMKGSLAVEMIYPNPLNAKRFVAVFAGSTKEAEKISFYFNPFLPGEPIPDFLIFGEAVKTYGWGGVEAAGFFSKDWDLSNEDYYINE